MMNLRRAGSLLYATKCEAITRRIVELVAPRKIILFGSVARGARRARDIDLLIVLADGSPCRHVAQQLYQHLPRNGLSIDLVVVTEQELAAQGEASWSVVHEALRDGKVLYAA
jgi:predicted nucleotidyltransferase